MKRKLVAIGLCLVMSVAMLACGSTVETSTDLSDASADELQERIKELEKENAELKQNASMEEVNKEQTDEDSPENWSDDMVIPFTDLVMLDEIRYITQINGREITYGDIKNITALESDVHVPYCDFIYSDITPLKYFTSLRCLRVTTRYNTNLDMLKNLTNLEEVNITFESEDNIDISALRNLPNLKEVTIWCGTDDQLAHDVLQDLENAGVYVNIILRN